LSPIWLALPTLVSIALLPAIQSAARAQGPTGFIPSLDARVTSVRFFETPHEFTPRGKRVYANWFERASARFIAWELNLDHPAPTSRKSFSVEQVWSRSDGTILARQTQQTSVEPGWTSSYHQHSWGWWNVDSWAAGVYRVNLFVDGQRVATGTFTIFRPSPDAANGLRPGRSTEESQEVSGGHLVLRSGDPTGRGIFARVHEPLLPLRRPGRIRPRAPDCNQALALDPSDFRALYDRGTIHLATEHYDKAIADLSTALAQAPRFGDAYGNRAVAYYGKGDHERAWQDVHKAQQLGHEVPASFLDKLRRASGRSR
jgi:hypothetical protein